MKQLYQVSPSRPLTKSWRRIRASNFIGNFYSCSKKRFQADMMEGFGERMKRAADSKFLAKKDIEPGYAVGNDIATGKSYYRGS